MNFKEFIDKGVPKLNYVSIMEINPKLKDDIKYFLDHYKEDPIKNNIHLKERIFMIVIGKRIFLDGETFVVKGCVSSYPNITIDGFIVGLKNHIIKKTFNIFEFCENPDMIQVYNNPRRFDEVDPYGEEDWDEQNEEYNFDEKQFEIGDRVIIKKNAVPIGFGGINGKELLGTVVNIYPRRDYVCVEFDEFVNGHDGSGFDGSFEIKGKPGYCWNTKKVFLEIHEKIKDEDIEWF